MTRLKMLTMSCRGPDIASEVIASVLDAWKACDQGTYRDAGLFAVTISFSGFLLKQTGLEVTVFCSIEPHVPKQLVQCTSILKRMKSIDIDISELQDASSTVVLGMSAIGFVETVHLRTIGVSISKRENLQMDVTFADSQLSVQLCSAVATWFSQVYIKTLNLRLTGIAWANPTRRWWVLCCSREPQRQGNHILLQRISELQNLEVLVIQLRDEDKEDIAQRAVGQALQLLKHQKLTRVQITTSRLGSRAAQAVLAEGFVHAVSLEGVYKIVAPSGAQITFAATVALKRVGR